jgi:hypothetical protein
VALLLFWYFFPEIVPHHKAEIRFLALLFLVASVGTVVAYFRLWTMSFSVTFTFFDKWGTRRPKGLILDLCMPPELAEHRVHALLVAYDERWIPKYGPRLARAIFAAQSLGSVLSFWTDWLMQRLKLLEILRRS